MHAACSNKLLKLLEEPPERTLFLLVSETPDQILGTILSRCQHVHIPAIEEAMIAAALRERDEDLDIVAAHDFAHIARGSYLAAKKIAEHDLENAEHFDNFIFMMRKAWLVGNKRDYNALKELKDWSEKMAALPGGREKQKNFLQYAQKQIRENFIFNLKQSAINYLTHVERDFAQKFSPFVNTSNVEAIMLELERAETQITQNGNAKIIFFDMALQMIVLVKEKK